MEPWPKMQEVVVKAREFIAAMAAELSRAHQLFASRHLLLKHLQRQRQRQTRELASEAKDAVSNDQKTLSLVRGMATIAGQSWLTIATTPVSAARKSKHDDAIARTHSKELGRSIMSEANYILDRLTSSLVRGTAKEMDQSHQQLQIQRPTKSAANCCIQRLSSHPQCTRNIENTSMWMYTFNQLRLSTMLVRGTAKRWRSSISSSNTNHNRDGSSGNDGENSQLSSSMQCVVVSEGNPRRTLPYLWRQCASAISQARYFWAQSLSRSLSKVPDVHQKVPEVYPTVSFQRECEKISSFEYSIFPILKKLY